MESELVSLSELNNGLKALDISLSLATQEKLIAYIELLYKWNQTYNLTALRNKFQMLTHHVFDSLSVLPYVKEARTLIDVGTGGGMPGIPLAIAKPDLKIRLIDSNNKKTTFLTQVIIELALHNVTVKQARIETLQGDKFDVITSRAFAELADFVSMTKQLLSENGFWLAMKGTYPYEEITKIPNGIIVKEVQPIHVPQINAERHIILLEPERY